MNTSLSRGAVLLAYCASLFSALGVQAQSVYLVLGSVSPNLVDGQQLEPGTIINTRENGLVVLTYSWPSDVPGYGCEEIVTVGSWQHYEVRQPDQEQRGVRRCGAMNQQGALQVLTQRTSSIAVVTYYSEPKADAPPPPARVGQSQERASPVLRRIDELRAGRSR